MTVPNLHPLGTLLTLPPVVHDDLEMPDTRLVTDHVFGIVGQMADLFIVVARE